MLGLSLNTIGALALSQLLFMCAFFVFNHREQFIGRLIALYSFCVACHVFSSSIAVDAPAVLQFLLRSFAIIAPAALWLLALYLFVDNPRVPKPVWALIASYFLMRTLAFRMSGTEVASMEAFYIGGYIIPQLIMMGFCIHALYLAIQDIGNDLVETRRRIREPFMIAMGMLVLAILIRGVVVAFEHYVDQLGFRISPMPNELLFAYLFFITLLFNIGCMRLHGDALQIITLPIERRSSTLQSVPNSKEKVDNPALVKRIYAVLNEEQLYTKTGLTIGELAKRLSMQEYRLRRVINKQLGFRNFNQFMNELRVEEACRRLSEPSAHREQIATIAYDVGYSALSSFNKAFKELRNLTPTQYRDKMQQAAASQATQPPSDLVEHMHKQSTF